MNKFIIPLVLVGVLLVGGGAFASWHFVFDKEEVVEVVSSDQAEPEVDVEEEASDEVEEEVDEEVAAEVAVAPKPVVVAPVVKTLECSTVSCLIDGVKRNIPVDYSAIIDEMPVAGVHYRFVDSWKYIPTNGSGVYLFSGAIKATVSFTDTWFYDVVRSEALSESGGLGDQWNQFSDEELYKMQATLEDQYSLFVDAFDSSVACESGDRSALIAKLEELFVEKTSRTDWNDSFFVVFNQSPYTADTAWSFCN